ncbi:Rrf2 family transcriptional regulator [Catellatospora sp. TT07R-123]|uniref:RrF2 family transcriptional regulator n=1 Tax=Catellatospora sp. TT07R-123 TaxID=2733863 RepID=UPI001B1B1AF9|nr:Rrf2 family transcriptional regulator [Catellatospora sp. TT07R-123]GHJ47008.1 Rrf2 family transcriptional regulator [Catellatospora sp. TT07R-123]
MHITARHDYAVQAMLAIAAAGGAHVSTSQLAARQGIPATYLPPLLYDLRRAELLLSRAGNDGGYSLARPAELISIGDVMRAVSGELSSIRGRPPHAITYVGSARALPLFWRSLHAAAGGMLNSTSLRDLLDQLTETGG